MSWIGRQAVKQAAGGRLGCAGWAGVLLIPVPTVSSWWLAIVGTTGDEVVAPSLRLLALGVAVMFTAVWLMIAAVPLKVRGRFAKVLARVVAVGLFVGLSLFALGAVWVVVERFVEGDGELGENLVMAGVALFLLAVPLIFVFSKYIPGTGGYQPPEVRRAERQARELQRELRRRERRERD